MNIFLIVVHVIACVALIGIVLIQRGRGGGLVESFSGVESMFGPKTSAFLTKTTSVLSVVFFFTCLTLAILSVRQSRSLMRGLRHMGSQNLPVAAVPVNKPVEAAAVPNKPAQAEKAVEEAPAQAKEAVKQTEAAQATPKPEAPKETPKAQ